MKEGCAGPRGGAFWRTPPAPRPLQAKTRPSVTRGTTGLFDTSL